MRQRALLQSKVVFSGKYIFVLITVLHGPLLKYQLQSNAKKNSQ